MTSSPKPSSLIVVTGASTGMGAATARELASRGFHVLAGVRRESDQVPPFLLLAIATSRDLSSG